MPADANPEDTEHKDLGMYDYCGSHENPEFVKKSQGCTEEYLDKKQLNSTFNEICVGKMSC